MQWLFIIGVIVIIGVWIHDAYQKARATRATRERQQLSAANEAAAIQRVRPIVETAYVQLTDEIRQKWPLIRFRFPSVNDLLARQENTFPRHYSYQDDRILAKQLLDPVVSSAITDFIDHTWALSEYASIPSVAPKSNVDLSHKSASFANSPRTPADWPRRRQQVHSTDKGLCRRCGTSVPLEKCHIHHMVRRSAGGNHSIDNLVTLCRDCHSLMPEHDKVTGGPFYARRDRYTLHTRDCHHAIGAYHVPGSLPVLIRKGYSPCQKCVQTLHWSLWIEHFARQRLSLIIDSMFSGYPEAPHSFSDGTAQQVTGADRTSVVK